MSDTDKWRLHHGIHKGTITSRDTANEEYDSEQEARDAFTSAKELYRRLGYQIWFAYLYSPTGDTIVLDLGNTNYS